MKFKLDKQILNVWILIVLALSSFYGMAGLQALDSGCCGCSKSGEVNIDTLILDALDYAYGAKDPWRRSAWLHLAWAYYILGIGEEYNNFHYAMVSAIETSDMLIVMMEEHPGDYSAVEENLREWILMCKQLYRETYGGPDLEYVEVDPTWWTN